MVGYRIASPIKGEYFNLKGHKILYFATTTKKLKQDSNFLKGFQEHRLGFSEEGDNGQEWLYQQE